MLLVRNSPGTGPDSEPLQSRPRRRPGRDRRGQRARSRNAEGGMPGSRPGTGRRCLGFRPPGWMRRSPPSPRPSSARQRRGVGRAAGSLGLAHFTTIRLWLRHLSSQPVRHCELPANTAAQPSLSREWFLRKHAVIARTFGTSSAQSRYTSGLQLARCAGVPRYCVCDAVSCSSDWGAANAVHPVATARTAARYTTLIMNSP